MADTTFTMENYDRKAPFSGFLPGLAGIHGIPIWCYYVNRGQCISSFGVSDKDHAIMEFFPAQQSYEHTQLRGFRTFVKKDGQYLELFASEDTGKKMHVEMNALAIEEKDSANGLHTRVDYFILPEEKTGALVRKVSITNLSEKSICLQVLDGMPVLIPYGVSMDSVKNMGHTSKAWMQAEAVETGAPYFRVRASMADTACVTEVLGGNYGFACQEGGERLAVVADPSLVFGYEVSMQRAAGFRDMEFSEFLRAEQVKSNQYPCCFFAAEKVLRAEESLTLYEMIGQVENRGLLEDILKRKPDGAFFERKLEMALRQPEELCRVIDTKTADPKFDIYSRYTYMDNVLRGGFPVQLPGGRIFYVYSRKHGDLERDYNYFRMLPEFYSQGNGNFRDVNQNRRCDTFFTPYVDKENIVKFYSLIQLDGYNPLAVEKVTYTLDPVAGAEIFDTFSQEAKEELLGFLGAPFTPGSFFAKLDELGVREVEEEERYFARVMEKVSASTNADFGEGYWSDHWTYNLDLIESYLQIYPEREKALLLDTPVTYYRSQAKILPRRKRYVRTENGIRQYRFLDETKKAEGGDKLLRDRFGQGDVVEVSLLEKLILLCTTKYAALDAFGCGVEMEGGKPGWYDALNGLPGLLGSSMAETYELSRMLDFTIGAVKKYQPDLELVAETAQLLESLGKITLEHMNRIARGCELVEFWNQRNDVKEAYWEKTFSGISGARTAVPAGKLLEELENMQAVVKLGIRKACAAEKGICPTYFTYEVKEFSEDEDGIYPESFVQNKVPLFLEGPVRFLKLKNSIEEKKALYERVKGSDLYDDKLSMYKVNASLAEASIELGRAKAFTPGWLENESIWLHMEYKYLLELLRSGMYREFAEDFKKAAIPFQNPEVYGRSIYENSSFIASSKNPNKAYHGQGFVARLSGSTVEFLSMWIGMMFGELFSWEDGQLKLSLTPALPAYLVGEGRRVEAALLGNTRVIYEAAENRDYFPGTYTIPEMELIYRDGSAFKTGRGVVTGTVAEDVRAGKVAEIRVKLE